MTKRVTLLFVQFLIVLLVLEGGIRWSGNQKTNGERIYGHYVSHYRADGLYPCAHNVHGDDTITFGGNEFNYDFPTNSLGFTEPGSGEGEA